MSSSRVAVDVGILVADMEKALSFYRDLLGLSVVTEITTSLIGKGIMIQLKHGASLIKLVKLDDIPSRQTSTGISTTLGYRYITLHLPDITEMMSKIEDAHVPIVVPITQLGNGVAIVMVEDPDGNIVEFVQESFSTST